MGWEIERKFLIAPSADSLESLAGAQTLKIERITQGFLNMNPERVVRVRVTEDLASKTAKGFLTVKGKSKGARRREIETEIPAQTASELMEMAEGFLIEKIRRTVLCEGKTWEVDEFFLENTGLRVAEIELGSEEESFKKPAWVGAELTEDQRYANSNLAKEPWGSWGAKENKGPGVKP